MTKRVLLTGASTGIGNATLQRLVAGGHDVTTLDVKDAPVGTAQHSHCDLSDPASIDAVVDQLDGPFDGLGNITGLAGSMGVELVLRVTVYPAFGAVRPPGAGVRKRQSSPTGATAHYRRLGDGYYRAESSHGSAGYRAGHPRVGAE